MRTRIGHLLVQDGLVSEAQLARALEVQNFAGGRIGTLLMERGALGEDDLGRCLALQHGCGYVPWSTLSKIQAETIAALPARFALKHCAVPYERGEGYVKMASRDPGDLRILDELVFVTGRRVTLAVAPEVRIYQALEKYYGKLREPRYAILAEKLSRQPRARPVRPAAPPPTELSPEEMPWVKAPTPSATEDLGEAESAGPSPVAEAPFAPAQENAAEAPPEARTLPEAPADWSSFGALAPEPPQPGELESIAWEDTTGSRSRPKPEAAPASLPPPFEEAMPFDFAVFDSLEEPVPQPPPPAPPDRGFSDVLGATERDTIADAVLEALIRRFSSAAIFSSRSDAVAGWSAAGEKVNGAAVRAFTTPWSEPSVFLRARLSRTSYLGPLPPLPHHEQLAAALGGWPGECVVQPVFIGDKSVAFLLGAAARSGSVTSEDLAYVHELAQAASSAFAKAIRLKKKEI
jgi:Type II secretion system (T2SS), protein E, N-terminal domain